MGCCGDNVKVKEDNNRNNIIEINKKGNTEIINIKTIKESKLSQIDEKQEVITQNKNNENSEKIEAQNLKINNQYIEERVLTQEEEKEKVEEERIKREEEEKKRKEEEERRKQEEEEKKKKEEEEKIKREEEERTKREEEEKRKKKEEEKKKKEEERLKKEEEERKKKEENDKEEKEIENEYQKLKEEELSKILQSDLKNPSKSCKFLGVYGNFFTDKELALKRLNDIRKEACDEGVKNPETNKKFKPSDYKPLKWSTDLEFVARIRALEGSLTMEHERLNGKSLWTVEKNGVRSWAENLAWNWNNANSIDMINQWYDEKKDWVTGGKGVTGHYESIISSRFNYVGLGWFNTTCAKYPSCLAGSFSDTSNVLKEDFMDEKRNIIQTLDILSNKIKSYYLEGQKEMKTDETQILIPRVKISTYNISLWPLKRYDLSYKSNNPNVAKVFKTGKIKALKAGNATITCIREDKSNYAVFNVVVKCNHEKKLINTINPTCTKVGKNIYECNICKVKIDSQINLKPHNYKFDLLNKKNGKSKGTCKDCKKVINFDAPTMFEIYWKNDQTTEGDSYWSCVPDKNPIGSNIVGWVHKIDGNSNYREMIVECDNKDILELPTEKIDDYINLKVTGSGNVKLIAYPRYNPTLKKTYSLELGN